MLILFPVHSSHGKWMVALHYGIQYVVQYALLHILQNVVGGSVHTENSRTMNSIHTEELVVC